VSCVNNLVELINSKIKGQNVIMILALSGEKKFKAIRLIKHEKKKGNYEIEKTFLDITSIRNYQNSEPLTKIPNQEYYVNINRGTIFNKNNRDLRVDKHACDSNTLLR